MASGIASLAGDASLALDQSRVAPSVSAGRGMAATRKAAQDFETFFASQVLEQMFSGVKTDSLFGGGHGEEMFRSLLLDAYAKQIGAHGSFGIGDAVMRSLVAQQEVAA